MFLLGRSQKKMATPQEGQLLSIMMAEPAWTLPPVKRGQRGLCRAWTTTDQSQCTLDRLADGGRGCQSECSH